MPVYPVFDLFDPVGEVTLSRERLYYAVTGFVQTEKPGFHHLYAHGEGGSEQLGLFIPENGSLTLSCRISCRRMAAVSAPRFSICSAPYRPLAQPLADGFFPREALCLQNGEGCSVLVPAKAPLPEDIMPFFCFLRPETKEGIPCLSMETDGRGMPVLMR